MNEPAVVPLDLSGLVGGETRRWSVDRSPVRIGRASSSAVHVMDPSVSREHAELAFANGRWALRDLGSRNGSRVNGRSADQAIPLSPGDTIEVGHVSLRVAGGGPAPTVVLQSSSAGSSLRKRVADVLQNPSGAGGQDKMVPLLVEAARLLALTRPLRELGEAFLDLVSQAVTANRYVILLRDADSGELAPVASRLGRGASATQALALSQTILREVLDENTAVVTADAMNDPRFGGAQSIVGQLIHSAMAIPLFDNERVLGILYVDSTNPMVVYAEEQLVLLTVLSNMAAMKISNVRLQEDEAIRQRLAQEAARATQIQRALLPEAPRDLPGWGFDARLETCYEVGGDLYDFHRRPDGTLVFTVGDVSGKGIGAALLMSSAMIAARVLYEACDDPLAVVQRLNAVLYVSSQPRDFLTLFLGFLDPATGRLRYVNAGHPDACLATPNGVRWLEATGVPVAMLPDFPWTQGETVLEPGELLAVFSDGIPEAQRGEEFFEMERVGAAMRELSAEASLAAISEKLIARVDEFAAGAHRSDDVTLMLARRGA